jgi:RHS repeat-associated protein
MKRRARRFLPLLATLALLAAPLPAVAAAATQEAPPDPIEGVDLANQPYELPPPPPELTDEQHDVPTDLSGLPGIWPDEATTTVPGGNTPPLELADEATPLLAEGSPTSDVYGLGANDADHLVAAYTGIVNHETTSGNWRNLNPEPLPAADGGWTYTDVAGTTTSFPPKLDADHPVVFAVGGGVLAMMPDGAPSAGSAAGDTITYPDVFDQADLAYRTFPQAVADRILLDAPPASGDFTFTLSGAGLAVAPNAEGGLDISAPDGTVVAKIPPAVAWDASTAHATSTGAYLLTENGVDTWSLTIQMDPGWLKTAVYPVVIDPFTVDELITDRDAYTDNQTPTTAHEHEDYLYVGTGNRIYVRTDISSVDRDAIVYGAAQYLWPSGTGPVQGGIDAKRTQDPGLPAVGTLTWNNQPGVGASVDNVSNANGNGGWWYWQVGSIYQHYVENSWNNNGIALTASDAKTFNSLENAQPGSNPRLFVTYDDLPNAPSREAPSNGFISSAGTPTLRVDRIPNDPNGDDVLVNFQISDNGTNWAGTHLVFESPFDDVRSFEVPGGVLTDGQTYYWRAQSWDVCQGAKGMCPLEDATGATHDLNASGVGNFTVAMKHLGTDPRYAMWSHGVGSNMTMSVNESSGNLVLDVPLASYPTPIGNLDISLSYNSLQNATYTTEKGWDLAIGPTGGMNGLPTGLDFDETSDPHSDITVRYRGGVSIGFSHDEGRLWFASVAGSGQITKLVDAQTTSYLYQDAEGNRYWFKANGHLTDVKLASSTPSSEKHFSYAYSGTNLTRVTDPLGRKVDISYDGSGRVSGITATDFGGQAWTLAYTGAAPFRLASITANVTDTATATSRTETEDFDYFSGGGALVGLLKQVRDAEQVQDDPTGADGWDITYLTETDGSIRVASVTAPDTGLVTGESTPTAWNFEYGGQFHGTTATRGCVIDPRGTTSTDCDNETTTDPAYQTQIEFNTSGLPIEVVSPKDDAGYRRVATQVFDGHNNLVCERSPEANAIGGLHCTAATNQLGEYTDLDPDERSTVYTYSTDSPWRLKTTTHPAPSDGAARLKEQNTYDGGGTFQGLWVQMYQNRYMTGEPDAEASWTDLNRDWGDGSGGTLGKPSELGGAGVDNWSLRLTGTLDVQSALGAGEKYRFKVIHADGVDLTVGGRQLLDCFGQETSASNFNCGSNQAVSKLVNNRYVPFSISYSALADQASLVVKWDEGKGGDDNWVVMPGTVFNPELGILTSVTYSRANTDLWQQTWTYGTDEAKARRLPTSVKRIELEGGPTYTTTYDYDPTYGHLLDETTASGMTTYDYTDDPAPVGWEVAAGTLVSCLNQETDPTGAVTQYHCDAAGNQTAKIEVIRAVADQQAQNRVLRTWFDTLGRVTKTEQQLGAAVLSRTTTTYDFAGRPETVMSAIDGSTNATTTDKYDHAGRLMKETLPNPGSGAPVIKHFYDWADHETSTVDALAKTWTTSYDQLGRPTSATSPLGAQTLTAYELGSSVNRTILTQPSGADTATAYDLLGRTVTTTLETYDPTTTTYDVLGNPKTTTDPAGIRTDTTYDNLGELLETQEFAQGASPATTTRTYDASGRLQTLQGPLAGDQDKLTFGYDSADRLISTTYEGVTLPSSSQKVSASVTYDDAGEQVKVSQPETTTTTLDRFYTYDGAGRQVTYRDAKGTTTATYNMAGWVTQVADPRPVTVYLGYDKLGRRICRYTATCDASTAGAETWAYDAAGNMTLAKNASASFSMDYDDDSRLFHVWPNATKTPPARTTFGYTPSTAQLASVIDNGDSSAITTAYTYNAAGQVQTIDDPFVTGGANITTYGYDPGSGKVASRTDVQANLKWTRTYEADTGRLDVQTIKNNTSQAILASFDLGYDPAGNVTSKVQSVFSNASNASWAYDYDGASRLIQATGKNASGTPWKWEYAYDGAGNRTQVKETNTQTSTVTSNLTTNYDAAGLATTAANATTGETITYTHDGIGDLTTADSSIAANDWAYAFDAYGRMSCAKQATGCTSGTTRTLPTYDALDRTISSTYSGTTTTNVFRGVTDVLSRQVVGSSTTAYANNLDGTPIAQKATNAYFYLRDPHGDVVGSVTTAAANQTTRSFDPFGNVLATTQASGSQPVLGYQGDLTDTATKLVDMGTRNYSPSTGRFMTKDVVAGSATSPMSLNRFAYGLMNPMTMFDPTGMIGCDISEYKCQHDTGLHRTVHEKGSSGTQDDDGEDTYGSDGPDEEVPPVPTPDFPGKYVPWVIDRRQMIADASRAYGVPQSVIAGALTTELWLDPRSQSELEFERLVLLSCQARFISNGSICQNHSLGIAQIQVRRALLADPLVMAHYGFDSNGLKPGSCHGPFGILCDKWDRTPGGVADRLSSTANNDEWSIQYAGAYLSVLRDQHAPGTSWGDIFQTRTSVGEWNTTQSFRDAFDQAQAYYSFLDG